MPFVLALLFYSTIHLKKIGLWKTAGAIHDSAAIIHLHVKIYGIILFYEYMFTIIGTLYVGSVMRRITA